MQYVHFVKVVYHVDRNITPSRVSNLPDSKTSFQIRARTTPRFQLKWFLI